VAFLNFSLLLTDRTAGRYLKILSIFLGLYTIIRIKLRSFYPMNLPSSFLAGNPQVMLKNQKNKKPGFLPGRTQQLKKQE